MGRLATLISFVRSKAVDAFTSDVKVDTGGGANKTVNHFSSPGDDSFPLPNDIVVLVDLPGSGQQGAIGYLDPLNEPQAEAGDKRIYARKANGTVAAYAWLKSDGSVIIANDNGVLTLDSDGTVSLNGVTIDPNGNVIANSISASSVKAAGNELDGHDHGPGTYSNSGGPVTGDSGPNQ